MSDKLKPEIGFGEQHEIAKRPLVAEIGCGAGMATGYCPALIRYSEYKKAKAEGKSASGALTDQEAVLYGKYFAEQLLAGQANYIGFDIDNATLNYKDAKRLGLDREGIEFRQVEDAFSRLPLGNESVDFLILRGVEGKVPKGGKVKNRNFGEIDRVLKGGGYLFCDNYFIFSLEEANLPNSYKLIEQDTVNLDGVTQINYLFQKQKQ